VGEGHLCQKEHNLRRHYENFHKTKVGLLKGNLKGGKLKGLKSDLQHPQNKFSVCTKSSAAASRAGLAVSKLQ
jgi:hypothetical protein